MHSLRVYAGIVFASVVGTLLVVGALGIGGFFFLSSHPELWSRLFPQPGEESPSGDFAHYISASNQDVVIGTVREANKAVVAITVSKEVPTYEQYLREVPSPFGFFGFQIPEMRQNGTEKRELGGGSGFLVSSDGYIVTNRHVVADTEAEYTVFLSDEKKYDAKVIARDTALDIAVLKIEGSDFPHLSFGDSDTLELGQSVIAIGNALAEYRNTVSVGVVSGLARSIVAGDGFGRGEALHQLIQTDAAINPGNSGGPLLNLQGEVVGVNVAVANGAENIGFSLSANSVKSVVESVKETGKIVRPFIGVRYIPITKALKEKNSLSVDYGILVQRGEDRGDLAVIPGSPADKAGIVENDIILKLNGEKLTEETDFAALIRGKSVGDEVILTILHKGEEKEVPVRLEEMKQ